MTKRLEILRRSLEKKQVDFDRSLGAHFSDVKRANGQPLNDKRDGHVTLKRWGRQNDALRTKMDGIERTKAAIELEEGKISECAAWLQKIPKPIVDLVDAGTLIQWRKHPHTFFVDGVEKARISFKEGQLSHRYANSIPNQDQYAKFRDIFNGLKREVEAEPEKPAKND